MSVGSVPKEVIKSLALEYQETNSGETLQRILVRVDRLIVWFLRKTIRQCKHLQKVEFQDLYHSALIGLANGIAKVKPSDTPDQAVSKLIAYIRCHLRHVYPRNPYKYHTRGEKTTEEPVYRQLESLLLHQVFVSMIKEEVITSEEYVLLFRHFVDNTPWIDIAQSLRKSVDSVKQTAYAARHRMRHQLRSRGITRED